MDNLAFFKVHRLKPKKCGIPKPKGTSQFFMFPLMVALAFTITAASSVFNKSYSQDATGKNKANSGGQIVVQDKDASAKLDEMANAYVNAQKAVGNPIRLELIHFAPTPAFKADEFISIDKDGKSLCTVNKDEADVSKKGFKRLSPALLGLITVNGVAYFYDIKPAFPSTPNDTVPR